MIENYGYREFTGDPGYDPNNNSSETGSDVECQANENTNEGIFIIEECEHRAKWCENANHIPDFPVERENVGIRLNIGQYLSPQRCF